MPGKLCVGAPVNNAGNIRNSRAFCEGLNARIASNAATNPHEVGSEAYTAYQKGIDLAELSIGGTVTASDAPCCAVPQTTVPA